MPPRPAEALLEQFLPTYQFSERHALRMPVETEQVMAHVETVLRETPALPSAAGGTVLSTCTRVHCPDASSLRRFTPYWYLIRPISGFIRWRLLQRVARAARASAAA